MTTTEFLRIGSGRLRISPWHAACGSVVVSPDGPAERLDPIELDRATSRLGDRGIRRVMTSALDERQQQPFLTAGYVVLDELRLLRHELGRVPKASDQRLRRGNGARDRRAAAAVDDAAFGPGAHLDPTGLIGMRAATPASRFRLAAGGVPCGAEATGYAVSGFSAGNGYLQRVAVTPGLQRTGIGSALVGDALRWLHRRRARTVLVNTEIGNDAALSLYLKMGFVAMPTRIAVLVRDCVR